MENMTLHELETQDQQGSWLPCAGATVPDLWTTRSMGAVIALMDITVLKHYSEQLESARDDARNIIETTPTPILVVTSDRRVQDSESVFL
jgi:hypothetical protein